MRCLVLVGLAACWHRDPAPPPAAPSPKVAKSSCDEHTFDVHDPACRDVCVGTAPASWPACKSLVDRLVAPKPIAPAPAPAAIAAGSVLGRIVMKELLPSGSIALTVGVGANAGITASWQGDVADGGGHVVAGGAVTLVTVNANTTRVETQLTANVLRTNSYVLLHP